MYYNNKKLILSILWIIIGIILIVCSCLEKIDEIWSGIGGGLIVVGTAQIRKNIMYRKNEKFREKIDVSASDERYGLIRLKAWAVAGFLEVMLFSVLTIIFHILRMTNYATFSSYVVCAIILFYWISFWVLNKMN